jgi:glycosyltransferase involved in cell wall biosynthesis
MHPKYVIITPVRDEEKHVGHTLECVAAQTIQPAEWVIVDDGSTDDTGRIIDEYAKQFLWIQTIPRPNRGFRRLHLVLKRCSNGTANWRRPSVARLSGWQRKPELEACRLTWRSLSSSESG